MFVFRRTYRIVNILFSYGSKSFWKGKKLFEELVKKGKSIESETREVINGTLSETKEKVNSRKLTDSLEERLQKVRSAFSFASDNNEDLSRIETKLDALVKSVDAVKKQITGINKNFKSLQGAKAEIKPVADAEV